MLRDSVEIAAYEKIPRRGSGTLAASATNTLYISAIAVSSNGTITLTAAWPENFLTADQTLDVLGKENLRGEKWTWLTNGVITTSATNISWTLDNQSLSNYFYKVVVRDSLTDMDDPDCDDILPAYVLPTNFVDYIHDGKQVPFLIVDQQERATVRSCAGFNLFQVAEFTGSNMPIGDRPCFNKRVFIGGDSGSPKFFLFGNIPVLIGVLHKASGHGSFVSQYITEITRAMDELLPSSGYHLNVLDLSPFETISPYEED